MGVRARGASKKYGTPYLFLQRLKLATSNLVHSLGLGSSLPRNNFYDQNHERSELFDNTDVMSLIFITTSPKFPKEIYILSETYKWHKKKIIVSEHEISNIYKIINIPKTRYDSPNTEMCYCNHSYHREWTRKPSLLLIQSLPITIWSDQTTTIVLQLLISNKMFK